MKEKWRDSLPQVEMLKRKTLAFLHKLFEPTVFVGNRDRVRKPGEEDADEEKRVELNRTWREMLKEDPWMQKLMTHVRLLQVIMMVLLAAFVSLGMYFHLPAKHWLYEAVLCLLGATLPYWAWIGHWHMKVTKKVFQKFKERFGEYFHLE